MGGLDLQITAARSLAGTILTGTLYSVLYNTYLDTSNPLLTHLPHPLSSTHYFASKRNPLNVYFIKQAWGWTTAVFLFSWLATRHRAQQTTAGRQAAYKRLATYLALTATWVVFTGWFFGPPLLDRVTVLTGGECMLPGSPDGAAAPLVVPHEYCYTKSTITHESHPALFQTFLDGAVLEDPSTLARLGGVPRLRKGHDVSGHIFLLTMSCMLLVEQVRGALKALGEVGSWNLVHRCAILANALLVAVWWFAAATTSVYFHSPLEKLTGFVLGYGVYAAIQVCFYLVSPSETSPEATSLKVE